MCSVPPRERKGKRVCTGVLMPTLQTTHHGVWLMSASCFASSRFAAKFAQGPRHSFYGYCVPSRPRNPAVFIRLSHAGGADKSTAEVGYEREGLMSDHEYDEGMEEEGQEEEFPWAEIPTSLKGLRACKRCSLVKGNDQVGVRWYDRLCDGSICHDAIDAFSSCACVSPHTLFTTLPPNT